MNTLPNPEHIQYRDSISLLTGVLFAADEIWPLGRLVAWIYLEFQLFFDLLFQKPLPEEEDILGQYCFWTWNYDNGLWRKGNVGEGEEVFEDYIFHGGDVGIVAGTIGATDRGDWGCFGTKCVDFDLYMHKMLQFQRTFAEIFLQKHIDGHSSRFCNEIFYYHLCLFCVMALLSMDHTLERFYSVPSFPCSSFCQSLYFLSIHIWRLKLHLLSKGKRTHLKKSRGCACVVSFFGSLSSWTCCNCLRTSFWARRKLLFHRVDPEAVLSCKVGFSSYSKVPQSPIPTR